MPFCAACGEIVRAGAACAKCGGSSVANALASGFSADNANAGSARADSQSHLSRAFDMHSVDTALTNLLTSPSSTPPAARKPPPLPAHKPAPRPAPSTGATAPAACYADTPQPELVPVVATVVSAIPSSSPATASMPATKPLFLNAAIASSQSAQANPAPPPIPATKPGARPGSGSTTTSAPTPAPKQANPMPAAASSYHTKTSTATATPTSAPAPVPVNASKPRDDDEVLCCMCLEKLNPDRAKRSREEPNKAYCHGCWSIRPMPERGISSGFGGAGSDTAAANSARQELDYQTLRGGPPSTVGRLPLTNTTKCATCHQSLGPGTHTLALGQEFHSHCFVCLSCRQPPGDQFIVRDGKPLCKPCYGNELKTKAAATVGGSAGGGSRTQVTIPGVMAGRPACAKCNQPIFTAIVSLDGGEVRCTDCFVCEKCKLPIDGPFTKENGQIVHPNCVAREACVKCSYPITSAFVKTKAGIVHSGCFRCASCSIELAGKSFAVVDGKEVCAECLKEQGRM